MNSFRTFFSVPQQTLRRLRGQGMLEFALVLPVLLILLLGIIELSRAFEAWLVVSNAARAGVRFGVTGDYNKNDYCIGSPAPADLDGDGLVCDQEDNKADKTAEEDYARLHSIYDAVNRVELGIQLDRSVAKGQPGYIHTTVCSFVNGPQNNIYHPWPNDYCEQPDGSIADDPGNPEEGPTRLMVSVTFLHPVIAPIISSIMPTITLHAERTGYLENFRVARVLAIPPNPNVPTVTPAPTDTPPPPTATPTPDCNNYILGAFNYYGSGLLEIPVSNYDWNDTRVQDISIDWQYVEDFGNQVRGRNPSVDFMQWDDLKYTDYNSGGNPAWDWNNLYRLVSTDGNGGSRFNTPPAYSVNPIPNDRNDFPAGMTRYIRMDFDGEWSNWQNDILDSDYGVTINFTNGCTLSRPATPRPIPTRTPTPTPLPACEGTTSLPGPLLPPADGWFGQDIGTTYVGTSIEEAAIMSDASPQRQVRICGSGADIWSSSDGFRYVARTSTDGIMEFQARLVAYSADNAWSKVGLMFRSATNPSAANEFMLASYANGSRFQYRATNGASTGSRDSGGYSLPVWLKVRKVGRDVYGFISSDGVNWNYASHQVITDLGTDFYVGLAVTSHNDGSFAQAIFDNVQISTPSAGSCTYNEDGFGALMLEAEHFMNATTGRGDSWVGTTAFLDYSGDGAMIAQPNDGTSTGLNLDGPRMDYDINFQTAGEYYVIVRGQADVIGNRSANDSIHLGLDGVGLTNASGYGLNGFSVGQWSWRTGWGNPWNDFAIINVPSPGVHTLNIWMREDGVIVDRIFLFSKDVYNALYGVTPWLSSVQNMIDGIAWENPGWDASCSGYVIPSPTPTPTPTRTATATRTPDCSHNACTATPTPIPTKTPTPIPSKTPTSPPTNTPRPSRTPTPTRTFTPGGPTITPTPTNTAPPTNTPSPTATNTPPFGG
ncbi:MAG: hypothetical protein Fur0018_16240 [Anaerolineales bacterium]